jgi:hypothetical protein
MLDPSQVEPLDLTDFATYISSCVGLAEKRLSGFNGTAQVARAEAELNKYPRLDSVAEPHDIFIADAKNLTDKDLRQAVNTILTGGVLWEHACAGEATRLGLGAKYFINARLDLTPQVLVKLLGGKASLPVSPESLRPLTLGRRHMLQQAWDLTRLAQEAGKDPDKVLSAQKLLVIVNESSFRIILEDFLEADFYGFRRRNVYFMVQKSFHGISKKGGRWRYDTATPRRLHNHGQMLMQTAMDKQVFRLDHAGNPHHFTWAEYRQILGEFEDKVSFNIEDLDHLAQSLDLTGLAAALKLGAEGARMVMEVVANNPDNPQKGGLCAWDPELKRNVMIESFQLAGLPNSQIAFLNKNVNHYPRPVQAVTAVREEGISMPMAVKDGYLYFQPVQGDVNFLVPTAFMRRPDLKPISAWKSGADTPAALEAMARQEKRPGFLKWAAELTGLKF